MNGLFIKKYPKEFEELYMKVFNTNKQDSVELISTFVNLINNQISYVRKTSISEFKNDYIDSYFEKKFSTFNTDNYVIEGSLNDEMYTKISNVKILEFTPDRTNTLFNGLFSITNTNKSINSYVKITVNKIVPLIKENKVEMDVPEFEKYFDVYSSDQIMAMRLLTHDIMKALIDFYKKHNIYFEIVFKHNKIYIRFYTGSLFELKNYENKNKKLIFKDYCVLEFIIEVITKVNIVLREIEV